MGPADRLQRPNKVFVRGLVVCITTFFSFFGFMFAFALVLQAGLGLSPLQAGITFSPGGLAFAIASIASTRIAVRHGARLITTGAAIAAIGMLALLIVARVSGEHTVFFTAPRPPPSRLSTACSRSSARSVRRAAPATASSRRSTCS
jgi:MFS family permease